MIRNILVALVLLFCIDCFAHSPKTVSKTHYDWSELAQSITQGTTNNYDKAYAIYRWLCDNIAYDTSYSIRKADKAYEKKRGVCQAYCELFYRLGEAVGLDVDIISGKSKYSDGSIPDDGHAWVFVRTDGNTGILVDPTWGAGGLNNGIFTRSEKDDSWFNVDPEWMIFTHYPNDDSYQLLEAKIDYSSFVSLPPLEPSLKKFGFNAEDMLASSLAGKIPDLPKCFDPGKIEMAKIPCAGTLKVGAIYDFILVPEADYEFVIINGEEYDKSWERNDGYHMLKFVPGVAGEMVVGYRNRGSKDMWNNLVSYMVNDPTSIDISNLEKIAPHKSPELRNLKNYDVDRFRNRGVDFNNLLATVRREKIKELPLLYDTGSFKLEDVPLNGKLRVGESYKFAFSPYEDVDWVIIENGKLQREWNQDSQTCVWETTIEPSAPGKLFLAFKNMDATDDSYSCCVEYEIEY